MKNDGGRQMTLPYIILSIVVIVLIAYGVVLYMKNKQAQVIAELDEQKIAIFDIPVDSVVLKLKKMHLTGQTKRLYESWATKWDGLVEESLPNIEAELDHAEEYADQMRLLKANNAIERAKEIIQDAEKTAFQIDEALQRIVDSETSNHEEIEAINSEYKTLRNHILTEGIKYKESYPTLESKLNDIEKHLKQFNTLMEEADYIEARDVLKNVEKDTHHLQQATEKIPALYDVLDNEFAEQVTDLEDGHKRLVEQAFRFKDIDIAKSLETIKKDMADARHNVGALNLERAKEGKEHIEREIDRLYTVMQDEIDAKEYVTKALPHLQTRLEKIAESNRYVAMEIDRVSESYELSDDESELTTVNKDELDKLAESVEHYAKQLEQKQVVFTVVKKHFVSLDEKLTTIDKNQADLMKQLMSLKQRERDVREQLDMFELDLRNMKRSLEKQHLPGLSKTYLDLFLAATKRIEELSALLNRIKIDMKVVDEHVAICASDIENLDNATEHIIDSAALTEQLIQYANRYRMEHVAIDRAITTASNLYQFQYKYSEAKQVIASALEKVDKGATKRVEQLYQEDKQRRMI